MPEKEPLPGIFLPPGLSPRPGDPSAANPAPARAPTTGVGMPPASQPLSRATSSGTPRPSGRVIAFSGPKEGVGKTTIGLNLALAWAGTQNRNVIIVHLDPLCRNELSFLLGVQPPSLASLTSLVAKDVGALSKLLKGRVPISQWG